MNSLLKNLLSLVVVFCFVSISFAEVRVAGIFGDHMVLQRQKEIKVWGWADAGETIHVDLDGQSNSAQADSEGKWLVTLPSREAGGPLTMTIHAESDQQQKIVFQDILMGEVWLCSGQSNMEWSVSRSRNPQEEIAAANFPTIRHFKVSRKPSPVPLDDIRSDWTTCSPQTVADYTAAGYYFGRKLNQELNVPIGLINSSWGGTRVEPWTAPVGFEKVPALSEIYRNLQLRTPGSKLHRQKLADHIAATEKWLRDSKEAMKLGKPIVASPAFPTELAQVKGHQNPSMLYNGMLHGFVGFPIRGAIWYQGESNRADGMMYYEKKKALINGWRELWGQGDFPFYFVQIAPFQYGKDDPEILAEFWEAQSRTLEVPNTGMVVVSDVGNLKDIHPKNKQAVGLRLANLALKNNYGQDELIASGPTFESMEIRDGSLAVKFSNVGEGLRSRDGGPLNWFQVIGKGTEFEEATVEISGDTLILRSSKVPQPVAMRFGWHKLAEPNLMNSAGLPASPFRAGKTPTLLESVPDMDQYQLIYDLDLDRLGKKITYDVDHRQRVQKFDRIAYLMELQTGDQKPQYVFVSMDSFTQDINKIGVPTLDSKSSFQQPVQSLMVRSNVPEIKNGKELTGHIEFWPNNYMAAASHGIGSEQVYDFDDTPTAPLDGYGSMQVHLPEQKQTLFAINRWNQPKSADLGIGNSTGENPDWTFSANSQNYRQKRLRVFVRPKQ